MQNLMPNGGIKFSPAPTMAVSHSKIFLWGSVVGAAVVGPAGDVAVAITAAVVVGFLVVVGAVLVGFSVVVGATVDGFSVVVRAVVVGFSVVVLAAVDGFSVVVLAAIDGFSVVVRAAVDGFSSVSLVVPEDSVGAVVDSSAPDEIIKKVKTFV